MKIRFVGDVHGIEKKYWKIVRDVPYSVQIGDMAERYGFFEHRGLDSEKHKFFGGNHDNYDIIDNCPHNLGDFGFVSVPQWDLASGFFFTRGAYSVDKYLRIVSNRGWWPAEELNHEEQIAAIEEYQLLKPSIMLSHDAPSSITKILIEEKGFGFRSLSPVYTKTGQMLQCMLDSHRPSVWIFGHWHRAFDEVHNGTRFICLPILKAIDL